MMTDRELVSLYEAGGLDRLYIGLLAEAEFQRANERNTADFVLPPIAAVFYYAFDVTRPPFDDVRVRRAFALTTELSVWDPGPYIALEPRGGLVPRGMPAHQPGIGLPYDPERARQLLAEAGYPGGQGFPEIVSRVFPGGWGEGYRKVQQSNWVEGLGIKMRWVAIPLSEMHAGRLEDRPHTFSVFQAPDYPDPDSILTADILCDWTGWSNEAYTRLVEEARLTFDQGQRMKLYKEADRILIEEAVVVPTEYGGHSWLLKPWVTRFPNSPLPAKSMYWKDVIIEPHCPLSVSGSHSRLSWPNMLIHQDTGPLGLCLRLRLRWRHE
jgi:ABC-type transport system substrate-binding protein